MTLAKRAAFPRPPAPAPGPQFPLGDYDSELSKIVAELNRAAPSSKAAAERASESTASLEQLLDFAARRNASDVLLIAGVPATVRVNGALAPGAGPALDPE